MRPVLTEGSVSSTVSVENRKCVQPKKTVTYNSGQTDTAVRYGTSGLTGSNIHHTQIWSCAPGEAGRKDGPTVSCDVTSVLTFEFLQD